MARTARSWPISATLAEARKTECAYARGDEAGNPAEPEVEELERYQDPESYWQASTIPRAGAAGDGDIARQVPMAGFDE
jgi:hypothetical protein